MSGLINSAGSKSGVIGQTELDYEEGAWTPEIYIGSNNYSHTITEAHTFYVKIGQMVYVSMSEAMDATVSHTGNIQIRNLPYPSSTTKRSGTCNGTDTNDYCDIRDVTWRPNVSVLEGLKTPTSTSIALTYFTQAHIKATGGKQLMFCGWYYTDS